MCKPLNACHTSREVESYLAHKGATKVGQCGSHAKWRAPAGALVIIPCHAGDLHRGTLLSIIKMIAIAGLSAFLAACYIAATVPHL